MLHQQGRDERRFEATVGDGGVFKARAEVGAGNMLDITGTISATESRILLDGYCKFECQLTRK